MAKAKKATEATSTRSTRTKKAVAAAETVPAIEVKAQEAAKTAEYPEDRIEMIRKRAYELFQQRNGYGGSPEEDWFRAEAEILGRSA